MKNFILLIKTLREFTGEIVLSIMLGVAAIGTGIGMLGTSAFLISAAALHPSIAELQVAIVGVRFFGITRALFRYFERLVSHSINLKGVARLREGFYRRIEAFLPADLMTYKAGDLLDRILADLETLENFYVRVISPTVVAIIVGLASCLFLGVYQPNLGWILAAGLFLNGVVLPLIGVAFTRHLTQRYATERAALSAQTVEFLSGLEDLQTNQAHLHWISRLLRQGEKAGSVQMGMARFNAMNSSLLQLFQNLSVVAILVVAIPLVVENTLSGISMAVILLIAMASFESVTTMPQAALLLNSSLKAAERIFISPTADAQKTVERGGLMKIPAKICFDHVSFSYAADADFRLDNVSFCLQQGKMVGIIGPSGSGKTSLVNLIMQYWQSQHGKIHFDGIDATLLDPDKLRRYFSLISQSTYLFSTTLRENLLLANPAADDRFLMEVLAECRLEDWVNHLPAGLDTWLGDRAARISGGERQRVAIARALLQNRPYLIMDEPVENLDPAMGRDILSRVFSLFSGKGVLWISHDLTGMDHMDEILVLRDGRVVERGDYPTLLHGRGYLSKMALARSEVLP